MTSDASTITTSPVQHPPNISGTPRAANDSSPPRPPAFFVLIPSGLDIWKIG
ncbi:hypothetical protein ACFWD7_55340 [Streptomyces mirabilis]|uniref:hypothetical protein n=1 Tax=Streptomyces mirabilis TaxID=68239 RepID=UPI0036BA8758